MHDLHLKVLHKPEKTEDHFYQPEYHVFLIKSACNGISFCRPGTGESNQDLLGFDAKLDNCSRPNVGKASAAWFVKFQTKPFNV